MSDDSTQRFGDMTIVVEQETDGRWIADIESIPGCMVYGATKAEALEKVYELYCELKKDDT